MCQVEVNKMSTDTVEKTKMYVLFSAMIVLLEVLAFLFSEMT